MISDTENNIPEKKIGFYYSVTDKQIADHQKRSIEEILEWIESTNKLVWSLQTEDERQMKFLFKNKKTSFE